MPVDCADPTQPWSLRRTLAHEASDSVKSRENVGPLTDPYRSMFRISVMRIQFSIRSLLVVSVVVGIVMVMLARLWTDFMAPKKVLAELNRAGAEAYVIEHFTYEEYVEPLRFAHLESDGGCTGLRIPKVDSYDILIAASQVRTTQKLTILQLANDISAHECDFQHLRDLHIGNASNQQVRQWVATAPKLDHLSIAAREDLTTDTFAAIAQIRWINSLRLSGTTISAEHIAALGKLPALRFIAFDGCELGPGVFDRLSDFPILNSLQLYGSSYDNTSLNGLQNLTQVTSLDLTFTSIDDDGIAILRQWTHLRDLDLYGCPRISPECVPDLIQMKFLDGLNLLRTAVEDNEQLHRAMGSKMQEWIM